MHGSRYRPVVEVTAASVVVIVVVSLALLGWREHLRPGLVDSTGAGQAAATTAVREEPVTSTTAAPVSASRGSGTDRSFESGLVGWQPAGGARLERVPAGRSGRWAVRLSRGSGAEPGLVAPSLARCKPKTDYHASVWMRASRPGLAIELQLVERTSGERFATDVTGAVLNDTTWRRVEVFHNGHRAGTTLAFEASALGLPPNASVLMDGLELRSGPEQHL
ncbi:MAG TPA: hypothetical protein VKG45_16800 [Actinomycetes bacterium]|nr:hypothetical protein [Actinomycetes bacterium]